MHESVTFLLKQLSITCGTHHRSSIKHRDWESGAVILSSPTPTPTPKCLFTASCEACIYQSARVCMRV